jgi:hypothetical protein
VGDSDDVTDSGSDKDTGTESEKGGGAGGVVPDKEEGKADKSETKWAKIEKRDSDAESIER